MKKTHKIRWKKAVSLLPSYVDAPNDDKKRLEILKKKYEIEEWRYQLYVNLYRVFTHVAATLPFIGLGLFVFYGSRIETSRIIDSWPAFRIPLILIFSALAFYLNSRLLPLAMVDSLKREYDLRIQLKDNEKKAKDDYTPIEKRAELQLDNHQVMLMRYYEQNLRQNEVVLRLGVSFIGFGVLILFVTLVLLQTRQELQITSPTSVFGAISGLSSNLIGAVFISMFRRSTELTSKLHEQFRKTNDLYFSSYMLSKISNKNARDKAYAEMSKCIPMSKHEDN